MIQPKCVTHNLWRMKKANSRKKNILSLFQHIGWFMAFHVQKYTVSESIHIFHFFISNEEKTACHTYISVLIKFEKKQIFSATFIHHKFSVGRFYDILNRKSVKINRIYGLKSVMCTLTQSLKRAKPVLNNGIGGKKEQRCNSLDATRQVWGVVRHSPIKCRLSFKMVLPWKEFSGSTKTHTHTFAFS